MILECYLHKMYECILGNEVYGALVVIVLVVLVLVVLVVCRVFVPFIACLGFGLGLAPFSMQLQGFCPPIIYQDDTGDENCVEIVKS